jgi:DNA polymerase III epsilon subunit-like protein
MKLAFVDTETTHLDPRRGDAWEIGVITRNGASPGRDRELLWQVRTSLATADPKALEIGGYHERFAVPDNAFAAAMPTGDEGEPTPIRLADLMLDLMDALDGAVIVGSNPGFDIGFLAKLFGPTTRPAWHYRPIDIVPLAAGFLYGRASEMTRQTCDPVWYSKVASHLGLPWKSYDTSEAVGVERPAAGVAHTALGDARWARDVYDAVTTPDAFYSASDEQLAAMASQALRDLHGGGVQ